MALAQQQHESDADSAKPWFPPPPTAPIREKRVRVREAPRPIDDIPPLPPMPPEHAAAVSPLSPGLLGPPSPGPARTKRKTLLERIDGWWDLGLLEKRQTLFGGRI